MFKFLRFQERRILLFFLIISEIVQDSSIEYRVYSFLLELDDFVGVFVLSLEFLMVTAALDASLVSDEESHVAVKRIRPA